MNFKKKNTAVSSRYLTKHENDRAVLQKSGEKNETIFMLSVNARKVL